MSLHWVSLSLLNGLNFESKISEDVCEIEIFLYSIKFLWQKLLIILNSNIRSEKGCQYCNIQYLAYRSGLRLWKRVNLRKVIYIESLAENNFITTYKQY